MFFLYNSRPFHMLSSEIDLRKNSQLRLLQVDLNLNNEKIRKSPDNVIQWFNSICQNVTSKSLVVEVRDFSEKAEICNKIQDTLLALNARIGSLSVYLLNTDARKSAIETGGTRKLFSNLYEKGIVIEKRLGWDESVCCYCLASKLPC